MILSGDATSKLSYTVQVDAVKRPYLMDAAVTWKFSRALRVTGGQFKIPFSAESLISDNLNTPIARARAVNGLAPGRDTGVQERDMGLQIAGTLYLGKDPLVDYATGVFRGQLLVESPAAHYNASAGRVMVHPLRGVTAGGGRLVPQFPGVARGGKRRAEAEGAYDRGGCASAGRADLGRETRRWSGGAGTCWARGVSPRDWEPLARADWLTSNIRKANSTSIAYLAGLNYYWGKHVKVGANTGRSTIRGRGASAACFWRRR